MKKVVNATSLDLIRIEEVGVGRAVTTESRFYVAIGRVLKHCALFDHDLKLYVAYDGKDEGQPMWHGHISERNGVEAISPWEAIVALADELDRDGVQ